MDEESLLVNPQVLQVGEIGNNMGPLLYLQLYTQDKGEAVFVSKAAAGQLPQKARPAELVQFLRTRGWRVSTIPTMSRPFSPWP